MDEPHLTKLREYLNSSGKLSDDYVGIHPDIPGSGKLVVVAMLNYFPRRLIRESGGVSPSWMHFGFLKPDSVNGLSITLDDFHWILLTRGVVTKLYRKASSLADTRAFRNLLADIESSAPLDGWKHLIFAMAVEWLVMHEVGHIACGHTTARSEGVFESRANLSDFLGARPSQPTTEKSKQSVAMEYEADQFANDAITMGVAYQYFRFCDLHQAKEVLEPTEIALGAYLGQAVAFQGFIEERGGTDESDPNYPPLRVRLHCAVRGNTDMLQEIIFKKPEMADWCSTLQEINKIAYETALQASRESGDVVAERALTMLFDRETRNKIYDEAIVIKNQSGPEIARWQNYRLGWYRE